MAAVVSIGLVVGFGLSFRLEARASAGPDVVAAYREAREACAPGVGALRLVTAPDPASGRWSVTIPCSRVR
jgi:predicted proteasome-type protease